MRPTPAQQTEGTTVLHNFEPANVAAELLVYPSDFGASDDRLYTTHAPIITWAEQSDDLVEESNYRTVRAWLESFEFDAFALGIPVEELPDSVAERVDVIDAGIRHWAVGQCSQLFIRVYALDDDGQPTEDFTPAWIAACAVLEGLSDYPLFDESDHSELEWETFTEDLDNAINDAANNYPDDTVEESAAFRAALYADVQGDGAYDDYHSGDGNGSCSWDAVAGAYADIRNDHFEARARGILHGQELLSF